jgi:RNA polymerase sigma factor for flagellar operon FliA
MRHDTTYSDAELLAQYRDLGRPSARDTLVERHLGLVYHVARQLARRLPESVELEDLVGTGTLGLMQAVEQFDTGRGVMFSTYAVPRIRGAMLDDLRRQDWMPRSARTRARRLESARARLATELGRPATPGETADALELDGETYWEWREDAVGPTLVDFDGRPSGQEDGGRLRDVLPDPFADGFAGEVEEESEATRLQHALEVLGERERLVLALYYYEELTLKEIGEVMGLTESRISQIRARALRRLERVLAPALTAA